LKVTIRAKSSDGEGAYNVIFSNDGGRVTVSCKCPAGINGKFCKHKWELMNGNPSMLFDRADQPSLDVIAGWMETTGIKGLYRRVSELEQQLETIKQQIQKEKKNVERKCREGF
jgi:hypothetical protein